MISGLLGLDVVRFGIVAVLGLVVDIGLAWTLSAVGGLALPLAATFGFCAGAVTNYILHEFWTFRGDAPSLSGRRGLLYLVTVGVTLGFRVAAVAGLERTVFTQPGQQLPTLLVATAFSFGINYLLSKHVVFNRTP